MAIFKKGVSGNPTGRPKGIVDKRLKYQKVLQDRADDIVNAVINRALDGDATCMKLCIDRIVPSLKTTDAPIKVKLSGGLSEQGQQVVTALSSGVLSPGEAATTMSVLQNQAKLVETDEIIGRIERLEARHDQKF